MTLINKTFRNIQSYRRLYFLTTRNYPWNMDVFIEDDLKYNFKMSPKLFKKLTEYIASILLYA